MPHTRRLCTLTPTIFLILLTGCESFGARPSEDLRAGTYSGLKGNLCAVMVWADWGTRTEYNQIQLDLARSIQYRLEERIKPQQGKEEKTAELAGTRFVDARSVVRYQREHPEIDGQPIAASAPKLGVDRVIYVEIENFSAQAPETIMLLKGRTTATLRVVEVSNGTSRIAFEERGITAGYPPNAPEGVMASDRVTVTSIYQGTVTALAEKILLRFVEDKR